MKKKVSISAILSLLVLALIIVAMFIFVTGDNGAMNNIEPAWQYVFEGQSAWLTAAIVVGFAFTAAVTVISIIKEHYEGLLTGTALAAVTVLSAFALGFKGGVLDPIMADVKLENAKLITLITVLASVAIGAVIIAGVLAIIESFNQVEEVEEEKDDKVVYNVTNYITPAQYEKPVEVAEVEAVQAIVADEPEEEVKKVSPKRIPFAVKMKASSRDLKDKYDELRDYILAYGFKSRISIDGDTFKINGTRMIQITVTGNKMKVYFALNPYDYITSPLPVKVAYAKKYKDLRAVIDVKSDLSVRRAKGLVDLIVAKAQEQVAE